MTQICMFKPDNFYIMNLNSCKVHTITLREYGMPNIGMAAVLM